MIEISENTKIWKSFNLFHKETNKPEIITISYEDTESGDLIDYCFYSKNIIYLETLGKFFLQNRKISIIDFCYTKENSLFKFNDLYEKAECFRNQRKISRTQFLNELIFILDQIKTNDLVITEIIMKNKLKNPKIIFNAYWGNLDKLILINTLEMQKIKSE